MKYRKNLKISDHIPILWQRQRWFYQSPSVSSSSSEMKVRGVNMYFPTKTKGSEIGFSLVELMVVVAIIAILSAIAVPRFRTFQAKARQAEAKTNLSMIFTLEQSYQAENDTYVNMTPAIGGPSGNCPNTGVELGFYLTDCGQSRYDYDVAGASTVAFGATATSATGDNNRVSPGCVADIWTMNQDKVLAATNDATKDCEAAAAQ